ncbi:hypothetical protein [Fretibacterium fastidiosum]|uniref:Uncharacterized protein n=1 Tax=Fretibacterium fastidiosum TaxID=651822 RepID=A0AB94IVX7_9BACT|nr:hypothetical protein [Fretibacterium fastidiosum]CBL27920.1 hypothetical protein SY1_05010 [Fretibacterium fastidiosum]
MTPTRCDPQAPRPEEVLRDRLLLYVRALRLPPREGLELVLKTMDELCPSGTSETLPAHAEDCDMKTAMEALRALCADRGLLPDADALPVPVPPYNRGSMPPARISMTRGGFSLRGLIRRLRRSEEGRTR